MRAHFEKALDLVDPSSYTITAMKADEPEIVAEATRTAKEVAKCDSLRACSLSLKMPWVQRDFVRRKVGLLKRNRPGVSKDKLKAQLILQTHMREKADADQDRMEKKRDITWERKALEAKNKVAKLDKNN